MASAEKPTVGLRYVINKAVFSVYPLSDVYNLAGCSKIAAMSCGTPVYRRQEVHGRGRIKAMEERWRARNPRGTEEMIQKGDKNSVGLRLRR